MTTTHTQNTYITATATVTDVDYSIRFHGSHHSGRNTPDLDLADLVMNAVFPYRDDRDDHHVVHHQVIQGVASSTHIFTIATRAPAALDTPAQPVTAPAASADNADTPPVTPTPGAAFYVTIRRGAQTGLLAGPFTTSAAATDNVAAVRDAATAVDPAAHFDGFGVSQVTPKPGRSFPAGRLNAQVGL